MYEPAVSFARSQAVNDASMRRPESGSQWPMGANFSCSKSIALVSVHFLMDVSSDRVEKEAAEGKRRSLLHCALQCYVMFST